MPHAYLVPVLELPRYGLGSAFLDQFKPQTIELKISTAGALGTMKFQWRRLGETNYSAAIASSPVASWVFALDEVFAVLTFGAGTYVLDSAYTVNELGAVTRAGGAIDTVTATRYDLRDSESQAATDMCLGWMDPGVTPPLTAWGADVKENYAAVVDYLLKSKVGMAATEAAVGDANVRLRFEDARAWFQAVGRGEVEPQDLVDSSTDAKAGAERPELASDVRREW